VSASLVRAASPSAHAARSRSDRAGCAARTRAVRSRPRRQESSGLRARSCTGRNSDADHVPLRSSRASPASARTAPDPASHNLVAPDPASISRLLGLVAQCRPVPQQRHPGLVPTQIQPNSSCAPARYCAAALCNSLVLYNTCSSGPVAQPARLTSGPSASYWPRSVPVARSM
jgi:hypothetical protein